MAKVNVYLPDDLERAVRDAGLSVSPICQAALRDALDRLATIRESGRGSYTPRLGEVLAAVEAATAAAGQQVTARHLLGGIIEHGENLGARVLATMGVDLPQPKAARAPKGRGELAADAKAALASAFKVALEMRHDRVGTEHVVIALAQEGGPFHDLFAALGIEPRGLRQQVERLIANPWTTARPDPADDLITLEWLDGEVQRLAAELGRLRDGRSR